jgi:hypothetical protein
MSCRRGGRRGQCVGIPSAGQQRSSWAVKGQARAGHGPPPARFELVSSAPPPGPPLQACLHSATMAPAALTALQPAARAAGASLGAGAAPAPASELLGPPGPAGAWQLVDWLHMEAGADPGLEGRLPDSASAGEDEGGAPPLLAALLARLSEDWAQALGASTPRQAGRLLVLISRRRRAAAAAGGSPPLGPAGPQSDAPSQGLAAASPGAGNAASWAGLSAAQLQSLAAVALSGGPGSAGGRALETLPAPLLMAAATGLGLDIDRVWLEAAGGAGRLLIQAAEELPFRDAIAAWRAAAEAGLPVAADAVAAAAARQAQAWELGLKGPELRPAEWLELLQACERLRIEDKGADGAGGAMRSAPAPARRGRQKQRAPARPRGAAGSGSKASGVEAAGSSGCGVSGEQRGKFLAPLLAVAAEALAAAAAKRGGGALTADEAAAALAALAACGWQSAEAAAAGADEAGRGPAERLLARLAAAPVGVGGGSGGGAGAALSPGAALAALVAAYEAAPEACPPAALQSICSCLEPALTEGGGGGGKAGLEAGAALLSAHEAADAAFAALAVAARCKRRGSEGADGAAEAARRFAAAGAARALQEAEVLDASELLALVWCLEATAPSGGSGTGESAPEAGAARVDVSALARLAAAALARDGAASDSGTAGTGADGGAPGRAGAVEAASLVEGLSRLGGPGTALPTELLAAAAGSGAAGGMDELQAPQLLALLSACHA